MRRGVARSPRGSHAWARADLAHDARRMTDRRSRARAFFAPAHDLLALVLSGPCLICAEDLPWRAVACVCPACWAALATLAETNPAQDAIAAFRYEGALVTLHRSLKFAGNTTLARPLARRLAAALLHAGALDGPMLVVPVPVDPLRLPPRRFAARRLARALAQELGAPCDPRALSKRRPTRPQTGQSGPERRRALHGAFCARRERVLERTVLVVDDVTTTGATLAEARRALVAGGASRVITAALARTPLGVHAESADSTDSSS